VIRCYSFQISFIRSFGSNEVRHERHCLILRWASRLYAFSGYPFPT